jgi:hypothetical protein
MNVNEMTKGEVFGHCMAARGVTDNTGVVEVMSALVDTMKQATTEVSDMVHDILLDFADGHGYEYIEDCLTDTVGEYFSTRTGEVVSVTTIP